MGVAFLVTLSSQAQVQDASAAIEELQKQIKALQEQVELLKEERSYEENAPEDLLGPGFFKSKGLSIGFYGEAKYRVPESGNGKFDPHRFVLTPSYQINDWLVFNSEIELEHGAVDESSNSGRNRFDGELELEQFYVDILINDHFNIRSPGIDLMPVGRINLNHEPTVFYSTERPELYREIIPSTWFEPSVGIFGKVTDTLDYKLQVSTGLEDSIDGVASPGITATSGIRSARPRLRRTSESNLAYSGRLHYHGVRGLDTSTSFYVTQVEGFRDESTLALWNVEALYRVPKTKLELRGDFAWWNISDPENLVANNNPSTTDDVGDTMYGWYVEAAYHFWPETWKGGRGQNMDLVPFIRYSDIVTQSGLPSGATEVMNGTTNKDFVTTGLAYFLNSNFVLKADWRHNLNGSAVTETQSANQDYFQLGAGIFF